jgi:iron(III) transport system substrate-binding protein
VGTLTRRALVQIGALGALSTLGLARAASAPESDPLVGTAWDEAVAAATAEGRLSLLTWGNTWGGSTYRGFQGAAAAFERVFPGIKVDWHGESSASTWLARLRAERRAGPPSFDVAIVQTDAAIAQGIPEGMWTPLRPLLFSPDVLDDPVWRGGLDGRFLDPDGSLCFGWEYQVLHMCAVDADVVPEGTITTVDDLLDPKWRGRVIALDPRLGSGLRSAAALAHSHGNDVLRRLLVDQRPTFTTAGRDLAEGLVGGRYAIALGLRPKALDALGSGAAARARFLDLPGLDFAVNTSLLVLDGARHQAAARLFANWVLGGPGQRLLTSSLPTNSARLDVEPYEPSGVATAGRPYYEPDREANYAHTARTLAFVRGLGSIG